MWIAKEFKCMFIQYIHSFIHSFIHSYHPYICVLNCGIFIKLKIYVMFCCVCSAVKPRQAKPSESEPKPASDPPSPSLYFSSLHLNASIQLSAPEKTQNHMNFNSFRVFIIPKPYVHSNRFVFSAGVGSLTLVWD